MGAVAGLEVEFTLNAANEITAVGADWDRFARENEADELAGDAVIGKNLLGFVSGNVTRRFIESLLEQARSGAKPLVRDYRCDSPGERRFMRMTVMPQRDGGMLLRHQLLRTERRAAPVWLYRPAERIRGTFVRCSMCNLLQNQGQWVEPETMQRSVALPVIYGICPNCSGPLGDSPGLG